MNGGERKWLNIEKDIIVILGIGAKIVAIGPNKLGLIQVEIPSLPLENYVINVEKNGITPS